MPPIPDLRLDIDSEQVWATLCLNIRWQVVPTILPPLSVDRLGPTVHPGCCLVVPKQTRGSRRFRRLLEGCRCSPPDGAGVPNLASSIPKHRDMTLPVLVLLSIQCRVVRRTARTVITAVVEE